MSDLFDRYGVGKTKAPDLFDRYNVPQKSLGERALNYGRGIIDSGANGLLMGSGDEFGAAADAAVPIMGSQAATFGERYDQNLANERARAKEFRNDSPVSSVAANIVGSVGGLAFAPAALFGAGSLPIRIAKGAGTGSVLGGVSGFGEGEGGFDNRVNNAIPGAMLGAALGGGLPAIGAIGTNIYNRAAPPILRATANVADKYTPMAVPGSGSAAATGTPVAQSGLAATIADKARIAATKIEENAALNRLAIEMSRSGGVDKARAKLGELGNDAFIADTSKGTERLANVGFTLPGEAGDKYTAAFGARNDSTSQRFLSAIPGLDKVPTAAQTEKAMQGYIQGTGAKLYDPVLRQGELVVSKEMQELQKVPAIREAMDQVMADAAKYGQNLTPAEVAHLVKQTMNKSTDAAFQAGKSVNKDMVRKAGDSWEKALWDANPNIRAADQEYAKIASLPDHLQKGREFMLSGVGEKATSVSPSALAMELPGLDPRQRLAFETGSLNTIRDRAWAGAEETRAMARSMKPTTLLGEKLAEIFGPSRAQAMMKQGAAERLFAKTDQAVTGGSQTAQRTAAIADDLALSIPTGSPAGVIKSVMENYHKIAEPSQAVRSRLADILANPDKITNAETLRLVEEMMKRQSAARPVSSGAAGATGGAFSSP